jgi:hypothetical protein
MKKCQEGGWVSEVGGLRPTYLQTSRFTPHEKVLEHGHLSHFVQELDRVTPPRIFSCNHYGCSQEYAYLSG